MSQSLLIRRRILGVAVGLGIILVGGWVGERVRLGADDQASFARVTREVEERFATIAFTLERTAATLAARPGVAEDLSSPRSPIRLFDLARSAVTDSDTDLSVTLHTSDGRPRAWAGRPAALPVPRIPVEPAFFVPTGGRDLRLVAVAPIAVSDDPSATGGTVVVEHVLAPPPVVTSLASGEFRLTASIADVTVSFPNRAPPPSRSTFELRSPAGELTLMAWVDETDLVAARQAWRRGVAGVALAFLAGALIVIVSPMVSRPPRGVSRRVVVGRTVTVATSTMLAYAMLSAAARLASWQTPALSSAVYRSPAAPTLLQSPVDVLLLGLLLVGLSVVTVFAVEQRRLGGAPIYSGSGRTRLVVAQVVGAVGVTAAAVSFNALVDDVFRGANVDLLNTSLEPWDSGRIGLLAGVLLVAVATVWTTAAGLVACTLPFTRRTHDVGSTLITSGLWLLPLAVLAIVGWVPGLSTLPIVCGAALAALSTPFLRPRIRHASHALRTVGLFAAFVLPGLLAYPALLHHGDASTRRAVETRYAMEAAEHPDEMQRVLGAVLDEVDEAVRQPLAYASAENEGPSEADRAFDIWRQTELARRRLTSNVEIYRADGRLLSRFALNYPEYTGVPLERVVPDCHWDVFGEIARFGSDERRVLHAERALCSDGERAPETDEASVVVHVASDYRTLSFVSPENPYAELLSPGTTPSRLSSVGDDVEVAVYGWGLQPLFASGTDAWSIDDGLFARVYGSRDPFWTLLAKGGRPFATYVANNRVGIYAVGYPVMGPFDHLVHLAEIITFMGLLFVLLGAAAAGVSWLTPNRYRFGRALLREVRTSFYRRLFLAFVAATLIPVLALAFVIRNYFANQLRADVEAGAARSAAVAQRVIEESFVIQQAGQSPTALINDDLLVWISQVVDQEVNIFRGAQLAATSERDLFASGLLPTRTPDAVYTSILLDRLPSHVMQDAIGSLGYLVAATPIRSVGPDAILTVPLASRQQEIERQIEDLDRGILLGVVLFVLVGAGGGLYLAERIADPVKRLTRATGQIARGDFDAHVAAHSADELQQLVLSFNRMAEDLKTQQVQLEKTHRLEAWADMARQVAHEIKNPLTPVQLSAEHLLRVHADRGEPLGPVLRSCVESILTQVKLLRQISAEFSSYASSPTVNRQATRIDELVRGVLDPYLVGLQDRIQVDVRLSAELPTLSLDRTLVGRALTNVIENALHAMPGEGALAIRGEEVDGHVRVVVADTGVGLDADTLGRIFEPYFSTRVSGTGLGMAIAKRNVELSDGTIEVSSRRHHGTTVTFSFPSAVISVGDGGSR